MATLKIVSDGTVAGTQVLDSATGDPIANVRMLNLKVIDGDWIAEIELQKPEIELTVESLVKAR